MARGPVYTQARHGEARRRARGPDQTPVASSDRSGRSGALAQRTPVPGTRAALPAAPERGLIDHVAVERPHVLAVIEPLGRLEAAAIDVLLGSNRPRSAASRDVNMPATDFMENLPGSTAQTGCQPVGGLASANESAADHDAGARTAPTAAARFASGTASGSTQPGVRMSPRPPDGLEIGRAHVCTP